MLQKLWNAVQRQVAMTTLWASSVFSHSLPPIPSASWLLLSLVISLLRLDSTPSPRQVLSLHTCPLLSGPSVAFMLVFLAHWAAGRKPFPSPSTLFPSVTPSTHGIISLGSRCPAVKETDPSWPEGGRKGGGETIPKWKSAPRPQPRTLRNGKGVHRCHWIWKGVRKQITEKLTPKQPWATAPQSVKSLWTESHLPQIHILKHSEAPNI